MSQPKHETSAGVNVVKARPRRPREARFIDGDDDLEVEPVTVEAWRTLLRRLDIASDRKLAVGQREVRGPDVVERARRARLELHAFISEVDAREDIRRWRRAERDDIGED